MKTPMEFFRAKQEKGAVGYMLLWAMGVPASVLGEEAVHDEVVGENPHTALGSLATRRKLFRGAGSPTDGGEEIELDRRPERLRFLVREERLEEFAGSRDALGRRHTPVSIAWAAYEGSHVARPG